MDKKNQHFVPQALLRQFTIDGEKSLIWELSKESATYSKFSVSIREICAKDFYYYQRDENRAIDHRTVENNLSVIEKIGADILHSVVSQMQKSTINLSQKEQGEFALYLALLHTRGPAFRNQIHQKRAEEAQAAFLRLHAAGSLPEMPPELQAEVNAKGLMGAFKLNIFPQVSLRPMIEVAKRIAESMLGKAWTFCRCSSSIPITDRPFVMSSPKGLGINPAHPEAEITIPLNRNLFIHVSRGNRRRDDFECRQVVEDHAKWIRWGLVITASEYVYSNEKSDELVELCKKNRLDESTGAVAVPEKKMWRVLDVPPKDALFPPPNS